MQNSKRTSFYNLLFRIFQSTKICSSRPFAHIRYNIPNQGSETVSIGLLNQIKLIGVKKYKNLDNIENLPSWANGIITLVMTFLVSLSGYILFFYLFSFGGGMLAEKYHVNDFTLFSD